MVGFIHGLTNLGGAPLVAITTGIYNKKTKVQANIAYAYLTMAAVQTIILIATGSKRSWSYFLKHLLLVKQDLDLFGTLPLKIFGTQLH